MTVHGRKNILVSWYTRPNYIPPCVFSESQTTVGPRLYPDQPKMMFKGWTPTGSYDLYEAVHTMDLDPDFDLVITWSDGTGINAPLNLEPFNCPKVLCVADTHHMPAALQRMIWYATEAGYDYVVATYNRQHLHWFRDAGISRLAWFPGLRAELNPRRSIAERLPRVAFFGNAGDLHPRRQNLLREMERNGIPCVVGKGSHDHVSDLYASSVVSFNASLNGDLNLRVFEILEARGCLLTDRLSPHSGLDLLLDDGVDMLCYDTIEDCIDKARFLLNHPEVAFRIAQAGNSTYVNTLSPRRQVEAMLSWVFEDRLDSLYSPDADRLLRTSGTASCPLTTRVQLYEKLQEMHRVQERPEILFAGNVNPIHVADAIDLPRLRIAVMSPDAPGSECRELKCIDERISCVTIREAMARRWSGIVVTNGFSVPAGIDGDETIVI